MAGNVFEWTHDWYKSNLGSAAVTDPVGPATGTHRVFRGGGWSLFPSHMRAARRDGATPGTIWSDTGFRCVRTL
jgi:formylglycine-generating enzyme required for sulfatase activity